MDTLHPLCAGLDVHKDTVVACVRRLDDRRRPRRRSGPSAPPPPDLLELLDWLQPLAACRVVGPGIDRRLLEADLQPPRRPLEVMLVNPEHIKKVPGRKTDVKDCEWIAQLLQHGLLRASFVPDAPHPRPAGPDAPAGASWSARRRGVANRIQKVLEDANIKLGSVATDVLGASGRDMLRALIAGGTRRGRRWPDLALGRLQKKLPQLRRALTGQVTEHHRFLLRLHLDHLDAPGGADRSTGARIAGRMEKDPPPGPDAEPRRAWQPPGRRPRR